MEKYKLTYFVGIKKIEVFFRNYEALINAEEKLNEDKNISEVKIEINGVVTNKEQIQSKSKSLKEICEHIYARQKKL